MIHIKELICPFSKEGDIHKLSNLTVKESNSFFAEKKHYVCRRHKTKVLFKDEACQLVSFVRIKLEDTDEEDYFDRATANSMCLEMYYYGEVSIYSADGTKILHMDDFNPFDCSREELIRKINILLTFT